MTCHSSPAAARPLFWESCWMQWSASEACSVSVDGLLSEGACFLTSLCPFGLSWFYNGGFETIF